jgi:CHAT domain-containing protein
VINCRQSRTVGRLSSQLRSERVFARTVFGVIVVLTVLSHPGFLEAQESIADSTVDAWTDTTLALIDERVKWIPTDVKQDGATASVVQLVQCGLTASARWQITESAADQPVRFSCIMYPQGDAEFAISAIAAGNPRGVFVFPLTSGAGDTYRLGIVRCNSDGRPVAAIREYVLDGIPIGNWRVDFHEGLTIVTLPDGSTRFGFEYSQPANIIKSQLGFTNCEVEDCELGLSAEPPLPSFLQRLPLVQAMTSETLYHSAVEENRWLDALSAARDVSSRCNSVLGPDHQYTLNGESFVAEALFEIGHAQESLELELSITQRQLKKLGPTHPNYASSVENLAHRYRDILDYEAAIEAGQRAFAVFVLTKGRTHQDSRNILGTIAAASYDFGLYEKCLQRRGEVVRLNQAAGDEEELRKSLIHLALVQFKLQHEDDGQASLVRALDDCPEEQLVTLLVLCGDYFKLLGRFPDAKQQLARAVDLARRRESDEQLERALRGLARLHDETYATNAELATWLELRTLQATMYGSESPQVADTTAEVAKAHRETDQLVDALREAIVAAELTEKIQGRDSLAYANVLGIQALVYMEQGIYARAEPMARQACEITLKAVGPSSGSYAGAMLDLSKIYTAMKDYTQAIQLKREVIEAYRQAYGIDHVYTSTAMRSLAMTYRRVGLYEASQEIMHDVLEIRRASFGENHRYIADAYHTMALTELRRLNYQQATEYLNHAIAIRETLVGADAQKVIASQGLLGLLYHYQGKIEEAREIYLNILSHLDLSMGDIHGGYATTCENLGIVSSALGEFDKARKYYERALELRENVAKGGIGAFGERLQIELLDGLRTPLDAVVSVESRRAGDFQSVYRHILFWKGGAAGVSAGQQAAEDPQLAALSDRLRQVRLQLSQIAFASAEETDRANNRDRLLAELTREKEALEGDIARQTGRSSPKPDTLAASDIGALLSDHEAFIDFFQYGFHRQSGVAREDYIHEQQLLAFVTRSDGTMKCFELGLVEPIAAQTTRFRDGLREAPVVAEQARRLLGRQILDPLAPALHGITRLIVSPDGPLAQLPLTVLPFQDHEYLIEAVAVSYATSARQWSHLRSDPRRVADPSMLAIGGITFAPDVAKRILGSDHSIPGDELFLEGSDWELDRMSEIFSGSFPSGHRSLLRGTEATKSSLLAELDQTPRYIHLATHGLVRSSSVQRRQTVENDSLRGFTLKSRPSPITDTGKVAAESPTLVDPLWVRLPRLRSALLLADERVSGSEADDNTLANDLFTAEEVMSLDLSKVEVVVLSACDTGLGDLQNGHGVIGLQRSFGMAGARNVLGSLWAVDDAATSLLVEQFYLALWQDEMSVADALRKSQLFVLRNPAAVLKRSRQPGGKDSNDGGEEASATSLQYSPVAWWGSFVVYGS